MEQDWDLLSSYAGLLSLATISIYIGSFGSLPTHRLKYVVSGPKASLEDSEDEEEELPDRISSQDAYLFPILGSVVLFGLYLIIKFLGKEWINWLLGAYFTITGVGSVWKASISILRLFFGMEKWRSYEKIKILAHKGRKEVISFSLRTPSLILFPFSIIPSALYAFQPGTRRSALVTDILALSFSDNAISLLKIDSFQTGCILLSGLFLYDIWWVFGTEVMVKVATGLDLPIKILWPKSLVFSDARGFTMLGLGDIVVPGLFISLALRFDLSRSGHRDSARSFEKPYFRSALCAYILGLMTTMGVMHFFGAAQPALLYLSPACILSFALTSTLRGELKEAWAWTDIPEGAEGAEGKAKPEEDQGKGAETSTSYATITAKGIEKSREDLGQIAMAGGNAIDESRATSVQEHDDAKKRKGRRKQ